MSSENGLRRGPTSPAHDFYEVMFQGADLVSSFWQPMLKGVGRWQLEMAQLTAKQTRASVELGTRMTRATSVNSVLDAYSDYWSNVSGYYAEANRNISTALVRAAPHAAVLELPMTPKPRTRDSLLLIDTGNASLDHERKVA